MAQDSSYNGEPTESPSLSNGAIFNYLERPLTWFSRTLNISQTATDTAIVTIEGE